MFGFLKRLFKHHVTVEETQVPSVSKKPVEEKKESTPVEKKDDKPVEKKETKKDVKPASDQAAIKSQGKLVQRREGGMIEVFKGARGKAFVCVPDDLTKTEAIKEANGYFKTKKDLLSAKHGFVLNDELYFSNRSGGKKVWVVTKG